MCCAGSWLEQSSLDIGEVVDLENLSGRICTVFGESARKSDTGFVSQRAFRVKLYSNYLTHELRSVRKGASRHDGSRNILRKVPVPASTLSMHTIGIRQYRIIRDNPFSNFERLDALTNSCDDSDNLMAYQRVSSDRLQALPLSHICEVANIRCFKLMKEDQV